MKRSKLKMKFKKILMGSVLCSFIMGMGNVTEAESIQMDSLIAYGTENITENNSPEEVDENGKVGKNTDIKIQIGKSISSKVGKKTKVAFQVKAGNSDTIKIKNVYPLIDSSFPFETSGDAYKVVSAGSDVEKQSKMNVSFSLIARSDIQEGYHGVQFMCEYSKQEEDGSYRDYYLIKSMNINFEGKSNASKEDDFSDEDMDEDMDAEDMEDEEPVSAPKLLITGYETTPKKIMAGETFTITIHIQNTSKKTSICNGKFLIGNEAGNFIPTSGSNAVFLESIPAGKTGDIKIEMKTSAELPQKNYTMTVKGDFEDTKGNNFNSSDNISVPVYQEIKLGISEVSVSPEIIGIDSEGSLMFTINNKSSAGIFNVSVKIDDPSVTGEECYVGNIAAASSAYATLNLIGVVDNSEKGTVKVIISYDDSEGNPATMEEEVNCIVSEDAPVDEFMEFEEDEEMLEEESTGVPWWIFLVLFLIVILVVVIVVILIRKKKKKQEAEILDDEDGEDDLYDEDF